MYRISRRGLLKSGVVAGVMAATGMPTRAQVRGGTLRLGLSGAAMTDSWDSRTHAGAFMIALGHGAVFDCLTEVSPTGELTGELATSWDVTPDARVWTFTLRRGVRFHDGAAFGADDVIASIRLHQGTRSPAAPLVAPIVAMRKITDHQVEFTLEAGNVDLPFILSDYHLVIYPAFNIDAAIALGIGTGLYRVETFDPGLRATLTRVDGHYKDGRAGWFDRIDTAAMNDAADRVAALLEDRVDVIDALPPGAVADMSGNAALSVLETRGNRHFAFPMLTSLSPMDNLAVRQALKHAVDRDAMVRSVLLGHGTVGNDHPIGPANPYLNRDLAQRSYDPDRARYHLRSAGLDGLSIDLSVAETGFPGAGAAADLYRATAKSCGIDIRITQEPPDSYGTAVWRTKAWTAAEWSGRVTEDGMFSLAYQAGAPWNDTLWENPRFQMLLTAARSEMSSDRRREMYHDMQALCADQGGQVIPMFAHTLDAHSTRLARPDQVGTLSSLDSGRLIERWWFA